MKPLDIITFSIQALLLMLISHAYGIVTTYMVIGLIGFLIVAYSQKNDFESSMKEYGPTFLFIFFCCMTFAYPLLMIAAYISYKKKK